MSDENFRRQLNQVFDEVAGAPSSNLRDRVRNAVGSAPAARGEYWIAAVAAAVMAILVVGVLLVAGPLRGPVVPVGPSHITPSPSASPAAAPSPSASPAATPSNLPAFVCTSESVASSTATPATSAPPVVFITAVRTGSHPGYDRITVEFGNGVPKNVEVSGPTSGTNFTLSPSGMQVTLKGDHGILVTIRGSDLHTSYTGPTDIVTGDPTIAEVRRVQDFEGVVQLGLGVNGAGCYRAFWLTNPDRLVIDVQGA
jgi:hypothetical protein